MTRPQLELTPDQIVDAIIGALRDREFHIVPGLLRLLATQDPHRAERLLDTMLGGLEIAAMLHTGGESPS